MEFKKKKGGRPSNRPPLDELQRLYADKTAREIAEQYGVKESTVRSWITRARREVAHDSR